MHEVWYAGRNHRADCATLVEADRKPEGRRMTGSDISGQDREGGTPSGPPFSIEEQRKRARRMGIVNHFTRPLLSLPFQTPISKRLMLIELFGRKSGHIYTRNARKQPTLSTSKPQPEQRTGTSVIDNEAAEHRRQ